MSAQSRNDRNKIEIKKLALYALCVAICLIIGFIENLVNLSFIAPGVKLGLSNCVALLLVCRGDIKGAFSVNIARILLSALLFGSPISLLFALCGGIFSLAVTTVLIRLKSVSEIGVSIAGGAVHNVFQCIAAVVFTGAGVLYYLPVLLLCGAACGAATGVLVKIISKKLKTNGIF